ncbi:short-chain dehydrogenase [Paecilomyces variotii No. 5]|uniref:Short-chain dehydrogenase n=1 Tax=Byssochlamys spectabilis (strain No. 5 / NBRC 109023) TaxID=1356009 RepID=V5G6W9_BYSSN|nr:short-chain dehydrogenase [Paecilomyces variotii No. 5]
MSYKRSVLVTGGTSGLGYYAALRLAKKHPDWLVVIASRTDNSQASASINNTTKQSNTLFLPLNLASLADTRTFVQEWKSRDFPAVQILLLNAALQTPGPVTRTGDGIETTFAIAHVGHALLFHLLFSYLAPRARIVITSSGTHDPAKTKGVPPPEYISAEELAHATSPSASEPGRKRYANSKLANVLWMYALNRRINKISPDKRPSVSAFDPGLMPGTGLARDAGPFFRWIWHTALPRMLPLLRCLVDPNIHTAEESGNNLAWVADEASDEEVSGFYFEGKTKIKSSVTSYEEEKQEDLWSWTTKRVSIDEEEKKRFDQLI